MIIFIVIAGLIIKCTLHIHLVKSYCTPMSFQDFGLLSAAGLLELIYEVKGVLSVFQRRDSTKKKEEDKE